MSGTSEEAAAEDGATAGFEELLRSFEGRAATSPTTAPDPVGTAMIRHFVDAVGDENPLYTDDAAALAAGRSGVVAPPAMLQVWTMPTLKQKLAANAAAAAGKPQWSGAQADLFGLLGERGFTAIVATDSEQEYLRELHVGDRLHAASTIETVSPEKRTALGAGHFVTISTEYRDDAGELVATLVFRMLLYRPAGRDAPAPATSGDGAGATPAATSPAPERPRPIVTPDTAFFFEGLQAGELRILRCTACGAFRHPPRPRCAACGSYELAPVAVAGTGTLHSWVVVHHPQVPGFEYPLPVGLVELTEGVRIVAELDGVDPGALAIGTDLIGEVVRVDDGLSVPRFRPAAAVVVVVAVTGEDTSAGARPAPVAAVAAVEEGASAAGARPAPELVVGVQLPAVEVPLTRTQIIAGALATRDFQDVHHDHELAHEHGAPDIFMNILTTNGLVGRLATDWAGPRAVVEKIAIRLGAPNYAGDTMVLSGEVAEVADVEGGKRVALAVKGKNSLGHHVTGRVDLRFPADAAAEGER